MKQSCTSDPSLLILRAPLWSGYLHHSLQFWTTIQFLFIKYSHQSHCLCKRPGMEVPMTAHFDCSFQHQQNTGFWKVASIYFFAGTSSQNGWLWHEVTHRAFLPLVKQQFLQFSLLCHLVPTADIPKCCRYVAWRNKISEPIFTPPPQLLYFFLLKGQSTSSDCF